MQLEQESCATVAATALAADAKPDSGALDDADAAGDLDAYYASLDQPPASSLSPEEDELRLSVQSGFGVVAGTGGGSGKRSRDEVDSGWGEEVDFGAEAAKKARTGDVQSPADDGEDDEDEFDEVDATDLDPNPPVAIGDETVPFLDVDDALMAKMTPDEYEVCPFSLMWTMAMTGTDELLLGVLCHLRAAERLRPVPAARRPSSRAHRCTSCSTSVAHNLSFDKTKSHIDHVVPSSVHSQPGQWVLLSGSGYSGLRPLLVGFKRERRRTAAHPIHIIPRKHCL